MPIHKQLHSLKISEAIVQNKIVQKFQVKKKINQNERILLAVGWFVVLFYGISTFFGSFNTKLSHFEKFQTIMFSIVFFIYVQLNAKTVLFETIQFYISTKSSFI